MTWQPIETAPKDGTWIVILVPRNGYLEELGSHRAVVASWSGNGVFTDNDDFCSWADATHWAPLP